MKHIWLIALLIALPCFAEELPPLDFSDYEVGKCYEDTGLITWMSEDKREMHYIPFVKFERKNNALSILEDIRELLSE